MQAIILAAGKGTRMKSELPKVLHSLAGKTLLEHVLANFERFGVRNPVVVVGHKKDDVIGHIQPHHPDVRFAIQEAMLGTGDAVRTALPYLTEGETFIVGADNPLFSDETFRELMKAHKAAGAVISAVTVVFAANPPAYGLVMRDGQGAVDRIVEQKDATTEEKQTREMNAGCYFVNVAWLRSKVDHLTPSPVTGEYYINDLFRMAREEGSPIGSYQVKNSAEARGINNVEELAEAEKAWTTLQGRSSSLAA